MPVIFTHYKKWKININVKVYYYKMLNRNYIVILPTGRYISIDISPTITIGNLKKHIEPFVKIPHTQQKLMSKNIILYDNNATLNDIMHDCFVIHALFDAKSVCLFKNSTDLLP